MIQLLGIPFNNLRSSDEVNNVNVRTGMRTN